MSDQEDWAAWDRSFDQRTNTFCKNCGAKYVRVNNPKPPILSQWRRDHDPECVQYQPHGPETCGRLMNGDVFNRSCDPEVNEPETGKLPPKVENHTP